MGQFSFSIASAEDFKVRKRSLILRGVFSCLFSIAFTATALAAKDDVKISILAVNPSDQRIEATVTHYLPPEIKPEDIIERAGFEVKYDQDQGVYYLTGKVPLTPRETQTIGVKVKNVWAVSDEEIASVSQKADQNLVALEGTDYYDTAKLLRDKIAEQLATIEEEKAKAVGIRQKIELYRAHAKRLSGLEKDVLSLESMRKFQDEQEHGARTAKFVVTAENPAAEPKKMMVRSVLPQEVKAEDVLDRLNFLLLYDSEKERYVLEKEENLQAKEKKKYEIVLRDIWYIPQETLDTVKRQTETLLGYFRGSAYEDFAEQQGTFIFDTVSAITALQDEVAGTTVLEERIRAHVLNQSRMELIGRRMKDLQDLLFEVPLKRQESTVEQIKQAIRSLANIIDIVKLGFKPDLSTTWWIILGLVAFLMIMSASFYVIWVSKLKETKFIKKLERPKAQGAEKPSAQPESKSP